VDKGCKEWYIVDAIATLLVIAVAMAISPILLILIFAVVLNILADRPECYLSRDSHSESKL